MTALGNIYASSKDIELIEKSREIAKWLVDHDQEDEELPKKLSLNLAGGNNKYLILCKNNSDLYC